jgi:hypothetical protein
MVGLVCVPWEGGCTKGAIHRCPGDAELAGGPISPALRPFIVCSGRPGIIQRITLLGLRSGHSGQFSIVSQGDQDWNGPHGSVPCAARPLSQVRDDVIVYPNVANFSRITSCSDRVLSRTWQVCDEQSGVANSQRQRVARGGFALQRHGQSRRRCVGTGRYVTSYGSGWAGLGAAADAMLRPVSRAVAAKAVDWQLSPAGSRLLSTPSRSGTGTASAVHAAAAAHWRLSQSLKECPRGHGNLPGRVFNGAQPEPYGGAS